MENEPPDATLALLIMTGLGAVIATEKKMAVSIHGSIPGTALMRIGI